MYNNPITRGPVEAGQELVGLIDNKHKLFHLFNFIDKEYGSDVKQLLQELGIAASFGFLFSKIRNKKLQMLFNIFRFGVPTILMGTTFWHKFRRYHKNFISKDRKTVYESFWAKVRKVFTDIDERTTEVDSTDFDLGMEILSWVLKNPEMQKIRIIGYYDISSEIKSIEQIKMDKIRDGSSYLIMFEYEKGLYGWYITLEEYLGRVIYNESKLHFAYGEGLNIKNAKEIRRDIIIEFINSLDVRNNHLEFDGWGGIKIVPRPVVLERITQVDIPKLAKEIRVILNCGRKRAEAFAGEPGTGKSSVIRKLEEILTEYIFVYLNPMDFDSPQKIKDRIAIIKMIQPLVLVIEDFDACDVASKNSKVGVLLDAIDDVNNTLNAYLIVNINDTSLVHFTVIDRPGRFDKVRHIKPPQSIEEIHQVLVSKSIRFSMQYCDGKGFSLPSFEDFDKPLLEYMLKHRFTQADLANAILEKVYIDCKIEQSENPNFKWESIKGDCLFSLFNKSLASHIETKKAIKECNFNNKAPIIEDQNYPCGSELCREDECKGDS